LISVFGLSDNIRRLSDKKSGPCSLEGSFEVYKNHKNWDVSGVGIDIAIYTKNRKVADKAKPRAIVGRKTTGPIGTAGLPKQGKFFRPVVHSITGLLFWARMERREIVDDDHERRDVKE